MCQIPNESPYNPECIRLHCIDHLYDFVPLFLHCFFLPHFHQKTTLNFVYYPPLFLLARYGKILILSFMKVGFAMDWAFLFAVIGASCICYLLGTIFDELSAHCSSNFLYNLTLFFSAAFFILGFLVSVPASLLSIPERRRIVKQAEYAKKDEAMQAANDAIRRAQAEAQYAKDRLEEYIRTERAARDESTSESFESRQASVCKSSYDAGYSAGYSAAKNTSYRGAYNSGYDAGYDAGCNDCRQDFLLRSQQFLFEFQLTPAFEAVKSYDFSSNPRLYSAISEPIHYAAPFSLSVETYGENGIIYNTTLSSCTCPDFQFRKNPCKHMFHLALDFGLLSTLDHDDLREALAEMQEQFSKLRKQQEKTTRSVQRLHTLQQSITSISTPGSSTIEVPHNAELPVFTASQDRKRCKMLSDYEYSSLPPAARYQLALEYELERKKNRPEIGRAFERYIGYCCEQRQYAVVYNGAAEKKHDLGRDLIAISPDRKAVYVIQCKYYAADKEVHENAVMQLFGSVSMFAATYPGVSVFGVLVASCPLSRDAKDCVGHFKALRFFENVRADLRHYPAVKCAVSPSGTKHFYLPFDSCYDTVVADHYELTVSDAMSKGFTRALKPLNGSSKKPASIVEPGSEQRVLRTAANGMQVWIPVSRLEAWEAAQERQRKDPQAAAAERKALAEQIAAELKGEVSSCTD